MEEDPCHPILAEKEWCLVGASLVPAQGIDQAYRVAIGAMHDHLREGVSAQS